MRGRALISLKERALLFVAYTFLRLCTQNDVCVRKKMQHPAMLYSFLDSGETDRGRMEKEATKTRADVIRGSLVRCCVGWVPSVNNRWVNILIVKPKCELACLRIVCVLECKFVLNTFAWCIASRF